MEMRSGRDLSRLQPSGLALQIDPEALQCFEAPMEASASALHQGEPKLADWYQAACMHGEPGCIRCDSYSPKFIGHPSIARKSLAPGDFASRIVSGSQRCIASGDAQPPPWQAPLFPNTHEYINKFAVDRLCGAKDKHCSLKWQDDCLQSHPGFRTASSSPAATGK